MAAKKAVKPVKAKPATKPAPKKNGRPTSYKPEYAEQAYKLCLLGATDRRMADFFGVSEQTLNAWKSAQPKFLESLTRGKDLADAEIANSLFHRAKGYEHPEDDIKAVSVGGGGGSEIVITKTVKRYPPDTPAAALWLKNRQPALWRDKIDHEHSGPNGGPQQHEHTVTMTAEDAYKAMLGGK